MKLSLFVLGLQAFVALSSLNAADAPKPVAYLTPAEAGVDFTLQGEYTNSWGGAQIIALGADKFRLVVYPGGLPGAGWGKQNKAELEGKRVGDKLVFENPANGWSNVVARGEMKGYAGDQIHTMTKVARQSPTLGAKPPGGAMVLFDGSNADAWNNGKIEMLNGEKVLRCGTTSKEKFHDFTFHLEFYLPFKPLGRGQDRGNSGVYFQDRYEVQVLDSFGLKGENNECGGIYSIRKPDVNMCFPALTWQTYDVDFTAARFDEAGKKVKNAVMTVRHNGVVIHEKAEPDHTTTASGIGTETPADGPIQLQDHGNPIYYRNIWLVPRK